MLDPEIEKEYWEIVNKHEHLKPRSSREEFLREMDKDALGWCEKCKSLTFEFIKPHDCDKFKEETVIFYRNEKIREKLGKS